MKIMPVFNMKGGVAKTTCSVMIAEALAEFCGFRVLIVDTDPQLNATRMLLPAKEIEKAISGPNNQAKTVARYLLKSVNEVKLPDPREFVVPKVGTIHGVGQVDLVCGTRRTTEVSDMMLLASANPGRTLSNVLEKAALAIRKLNEAGPYDIMVVDCPPGLTMPVRAALCAANLLLVPTTADETALSGIGNLVQTLGQCSEIKPALISGKRILVTRYENAEVQKLSGLKKETLFAAHVTERPTISDARLFSSEFASTFKGKYGLVPEREFRRIISELTVMLGLPRLDSTKKEPRPKEVIHVKGDADRGNVLSGNSADLGGKPQAGKKSSLSDLFSFSRRQS